MVIIFFFFCNLSNSDLGLAQQGFHSVSEGEFPHLTSFHQVPIWAHYRILLGPEPFSRTLAQASEKHPNTSCPQDSQLLATSISHCGASPTYSDTIYSVFDTSITTDWLSQLGQDTLVSIAHQR